LLTVHFTA